MTEKSEVEQACIDEHLRKFSQTNNTPPMQPPLSTLLGDLANTEFCENILNGTAEFPDDLEEYRVDFLKQLKKPESVQLNEVSTAITPATWAEGWSKMNDTTSSASLTGLHFGHLKASSTDEFLVNFESSLSQISFSSGSVPDSWTNSVICMIKKKSQVEHISGLRSILLTEADFNFNNKLLGKTSMEIAEEKNLIAPEQYGSRKGKSAIDHAINKRLSYDILCQSQTSGALCSNDAKSCFDRIVHTIAILAYRQLGISQPPMECMVKTIQSMKHHFRTSHGDSETFLDQPLLVPCFWRILQGNGAAPTTWVLISTPLLNMMQARHKGGFFTSLITKCKSHIVGYAYVDDTDVIIMNNNNINITADEIMEDMQEAIHIWEGGLKATGGAIVPSKSWVYPIDFEFDNNGKWGYKSAEDIGFNFVVKDENNILQPLDTLTASTGKETLGVILAPDGNNSDAVTALKNKAVEWKELIRTGHLKRKTAWQAVETTILKTIEYPLPALTLTPKECQKIMQPILSVSFPKTSISKSFPGKVLHGPIFEGGLGIDSLYFTQGVMHIEKFQTHFGTLSITGKLLQVSMETAQLEVGVGRNLFQLDFDTYGDLLTDCWIKLKLPLNTVIIPLSIRPWMYEVVQ